MPTELTAPQLAAAVALADNKSATAAAAVAGVSRPVLYKWLKIDAFNAHVAGLRADKLAETQLMLQARVDGLGAKSVIALERALECGSPTAATKAAIAILTRLGVLQPPEISPKSLPPVEIETVGE